MRCFVLPSTLLLTITAARVDAQVVSAADSSTPRSAATQVRPPNDSLFRRARRLVGEGNGVAGRGLVDSLLRAADPATPAYGDALYWHGVVALTAADAERDYRRVIVEYPLAYYRDDALLSIAELEQARGDRAGALGHLQGYVREHALGKERGTAALGAARLAFELRDMPLGCSMLAEARRSATAADVELRNQIDAYGTNRCTGQSTATAAPAPTPTTPAPAPAPSSSVSNAAAGGKVPAQPRASSQTVPRAAAAPISTMQPPSSPKPIVSKPSTKPAPPPVAASATTAVTRSARPAPAPTTSHIKVSFTVQLAAYDTRAPAEALVAKLATRGVKARVSGTAKPFRVRLGYYRTHQEAADEVAALKKRGMIGFVATEAHPPEAASP